MKKQNIFSLFLLSCLILGSCFPSKETSSDEIDSSEKSSAEIDSSETSINSEQTYIDSLEWKYNSKFHYKEYNGKKYNEAKHNFPDGMIYAEFQHAMCRDCRYQLLYRYEWYDHIDVRSYQTFNELSSTLETSFSEGKTISYICMLNPKNLVEDESNIFELHYDSRHNEPYNFEGAVETLYVYDPSVGKSSDSNYSFKVNALFVTERTRPSLSEISYKILENENTYEIQCFFGLSIIGTMEVVPNCNATSDYYLNYVKDNMVVIP